jgi:transcriptional regulator with XRE-family HTH domain
MEQTLGKRIAENRKRLGLTQDGLAEQLGLTAQAVSKWENDQSCPDITMLPRLAEIFGITTDELLGREAPKTVHHAEVVDDDDNESEGIHLDWDSDKEDGDSWVFHWDSGKRSAMRFAILVLTVGILTLVSRFCDWDVSFWSILWPSAFLIFGLDGMLKKFSFFSVGLTLFGGYYLVENLGIWELSVADDLIFPIIIVLLGISLLVDALRKPKKPIFRINRRGGNSSKTRSECSNNRDNFHCNLSFGEKNHLVDIPMLRSGEASVSFGELTVDLRGCESVSEDCTITANCSFGELRLLVPRRFRVENDASTAFASVDISGHPDPEPAGIINLDASVSFGEIEIKYI